MPKLEKKSVVNIWEAVQNPGAHVMEVSGQDL